MYTALYFPHTELQRKHLLRTSLLTWDSVEWIAPSADYDAFYEDTDMAEAMELLGERRVATEGEKNTIHDVVVDLLSGELPETFTYVPANYKSNEHYPIWPQKILEKTWEFLADRGLTSGRLDNLDYPMSQTAGLTLMAIIADVMAGETRARITDRNTAYATIANVPKAAQNAKDTESVIPLTFKGIDVEHVSLKELIRFRKRELKESASKDYRALRHNYLDSIQNHITMIANKPLGTNDREELDRIFEQKMEDDFSELKTQLGYAKTNALFSKNVVSLVLAGSAMLTAASAPVFEMPEVLAGTGGLAMLGGAFATGSKYGQLRREILRNHPTAYLHQLTNQ